jgi:hypothetical protein
MRKNQDNLNEEFDFELTKIKETITTAILEIAVIIGYELKNKCETKIIAS